MKLDDSARKNSGNVVMACKVYNKVIGILSDIMERTHGEPLDPGPGSPKERFQKVVEHLERILKTDSDRRRFAEGLDIEPVGSIGQMIGHILDIESDPTLITDVDGLTPNAIKNAMYDAAFTNGISGSRIDVPLPDFLRQTLKFVQSPDKVGKMNVGANRHFKRLLQYVREIENETWWSESERGLWLKNSAGKGRVAEHPRHPADLKITINLDLL